MKTRPISFSGPMVRAIRDGLKTQTRRAIGRYAHIERRESDDAFWPFEIYDDGLFEMPCKYGIPGDVLWVKEAAWISPPDSPYINTDDWTTGDKGCVLDYEGRKRFVSWDADCDEESRDAAKSYGVKLRPSMLMPRWASRITLEITDIRVERLNEISEDDAHAEGFESVAEFRAYWDTLNDKRGFGWAENPWVWVISFRRVSE